MDIKETSKGESRDEEEGERRKEGYVGERKREKRDM